MCTARTGRETPVTRTRIVRISHPDDITWVRQYENHLDIAGRLSRAAVGEIGRCSDLAFAHIPSPNDGADAKSVAGAVVGAVQSGKTGLMIHLAARALDEGFRVVIVLAGLRDDLRTQTALRFVRDLLQRGDPVPGKGTPSFTHVDGAGYHGELRGCWSPRYSDDVNHDDAFVSQFRNQLQRGNAVLAIAKKNVASLTRLREAYRFACYQEGSFPLLVLDDECDEASVSADRDAPTPDRIAQVWSGLDQQVTYVGFTATPAANLLQDTGSLLFPRDFVLAMRSPGDADTVLQYLERDADSRYTGGAVYYGFLESQQRRNFLVRSAMSRDEFNGTPGSHSELEEALIAYFVGGTMRLLFQPGCTLDESSQSPSPHTMLAHTESLVESHWDLCERIMKVIRQRGGVDNDLPLGDIRRMLPARRLDHGALVAWLAAEEGRWKTWYDRYQDSRNELLEVSPDRQRAPLADWIDVCRLLPHVFQHTKLRVVNSDETAVDAPLQFNPSYSNDGRDAPRDVYSVIIGGNRLSRGLTIEGLCISYYTRAAATLLEDTTVQRERWFGYRGRHLEFCRLFTHRSLALMLRRFHEHDEDLREQLFWHLAHGKEPDNATFRFLTLRASRPTAKLGRGKGPEIIDVSGTRPFIDRVQMGQGPLEQAAAAANEAAAAALATTILDAGESIEDRRGNQIAAVLRDRDATEIASFLEQFVYTFHNPDPLAGVGWNLREFYRPRHSHYAPTRPGVSPRADPFLIAAYMKFWRAAYEQCESDPSSNRYRSGDSITPWMPVPPPRFNLALRFGTLRPSRRSPFTHRLLNRAVNEDGAVGSRWGGRGYGSSGDEWIDWEVPPEDTAIPRPAGAPGLALVHIIGRHATGISNSGEAYAFDRPCVGLVIPEGGPCIQFVLAEGRG